MTASSELNELETPNFQLPIELQNIFKTLATNEQIIFKSQQIDDPQISNGEKEAIAQDLYCKNCKLFLIRFGNYMTEQQLNDFQSYTIQSDANNEEEMYILFEEYKRKLHTHRTAVKNRRYAAMQQMLTKGEYFSEHEMMQRAPALYEELIGQYMTVEEKKKRDSYDVRKTTFSGILIHTMEQKQREELMHNVVVHNECEAPNENDLDEVPPECRQQWGAFDSDEPIACSSSTTTTARSNQLKQTTNSNQYQLSTPLYQNPAERELLRHEFLSLMKERFLSGEENDFDYTAVDENTLLDDLQQIEQDEEDAYFNDDDDDDDSNSNNEPPPQRTRRDDCNESEDELDCFMRHLNKQQLN